MSTITGAMQVAASQLGEEADAVLEHLRTGEVVELTSQGRVVALMLPLGIGADRAVMERRIGSPGLRGQARYASEDELFSTGEAWEADR